MLLKIRVSRDGVQPGPRRKAPDLAQRGGQRSGLGGVAQALAVRRVGQHGGGWGGAECAHVGDLEPAAVPHPGQLGVGARQLDGGGVDIEAEALERGVRAGGGDGFLPLLLPGSLRDKTELFGRKAAAQAGRDVERFLRRFNDKRARTAERVLHERVAPHAAKVRDGGGQRFLDGRERGVAAVAALVQTVAGGVEHHLDGIFAQRKAQLVFGAGFGQRAGMVTVHQPLDDRLFDNALAGGHAGQLAGKAGALDREGRVGGEEFLPRMA